MRYVLLAGALLMYACAPRSPSADSARSADSAKRAQAADTGALLDGSRLEAGDTAPRAPETRTFTAEDSLPTTIEDSAVNRPQLVGTGEHRVLHLPPRMLAALRDAVPGFATFRRADFTGTAFDTTTADPSKEAPFAVIGDFDGDRLADVALLGRTDSSSVLLAILDNKGHPRVVAVERGVGNPPLDEYLGYQAPGDVNWGFSGTLHLDHAGFVLQREVASLLYVYRKRAFESFTQGD